ncbi:hypothetical protein [Pseudomonas sp. FFUP_PS_473]|jgi:hypothetical protein|nr:hypothetical protein [Pseudomonas sp. FFUP_PS_473]
MLANAALALSLHFSKDSLESMVNEALVEAQHMLEAVGVLSGEAA